METRNELERTWIKAGVVCGLLARGHPFLQPQVIEIILLILS